MELRRIRLSRMALMMLAGCVLGFVLLTAACCLPLTGLKDAQETADLFRKEGNRPQVIPTYISSTGDGYTDALMLAEALFDDPQVSPLEQAVYVYRRANSESASVDIADYLEGKDMQWTISYERYWHGFLVFLRPLLMVFSYADLRMLICAAQMMLFALMAVLISKKGMTELIVPFSAMILTLSPMGTMLSLQYFSTYIVMMLGMFAVLTADEWLCGGARYFYFFLLLGMLTCYVDFLTYPLAALCMPLALALWMHREETGMLRFAVGACVMWCIGYLGFWALKWAAGSLLVQDNLIMNALYRMKYQTSAEHAETAGRFESIIRNAAVVLKPGYIVLYLSSAVICALPLLRGNREAGSLLSGSRLLLPALALAPFAWWLLAANHSLVHTFFTYRLISITVFALLIWLSSARERACAD